MKELEDLSKSLEALKKAQINNLLDVSKKMSEIKDEKLKNYLYLSLEKAKNGNLNIAEFNKTISEWQQ